MASKKYSFLLGLLSLVTVSASQAQTGSSTVYRGSGYDTNDTALIPLRRMDQQRDFLNRNYDYPAKPRNQWELGLGIGALNVSGDINSKNITNYDNTLVTTRGQGNVISQIELPNQSNLSLEPGETNDQSYSNTNID